MTPLEVARSHTARPAQTASLQFVTPAAAASYLDTLHEHQRRRMEAPTARMVRDMAEGRWVTTHEGIAFDTRGRLIDGQHRLAAIVASGVSLFLWVFRDLPDDAIQVINRGKARTMAHRLQCLGFAASDNDTVAVARAMMTGVKMDWRELVTESDLVDFIAAHEEAIVWAKKLAPKGQASAVMRAAVARAYYHVGHPTLERFCLAATDHLEAGDLTETDQSVRRFAEAMRGASRTGVERVAGYRKWQSVIRHYADGDRIVKVYGQERDLFPLPEGE